MNKMRTLGLLLLCLLPAALRAQPATDSLLNRYDQLYRSLTGKNPGRSFLETMQDCNSILFNLNENIFVAAQKQLAQQNGPAADSTLIRLLTETVLTRFFQQRLLGTEAGEQQPFGKIWSAYNNKLCPCLSDKLSGGNDAALAQYSMDCNAEVFKDTAVVTIINAETNKLAPAAQQLMSRFLPQYIYANCTALQQSYLREATRKNVIAFYAALQQQRQAVEAKIIREAFANRPASVQALFPNYKKYKSALWTAAQKLNGNLTQSAFLDFDKDGENYAEVITAYVAKGKQFRIIGQLRFTFINYGTADFKIIAFQYTPEAQVKNKAMYAKRYASLPPDDDPLFKVKDIKQR